MSLTLVSPELALVDPELRLEALAALPRVEPFDFLRLRPPPVPEPRPALQPGQAAQPENVESPVAVPEPRTAGPRTPVPVAVVAYFAVQLLRAAVLDAVFVAVVIAVVTLVIAFG